MTLQHSVPVEEVTGDLLVLFHFEDVPVPKHTLGKVDWYLSGAISRLAVEGKFTGAVGSAALLHPSGKFQVEKILVLGLGPSARVDFPALQATATHLRSLLDNLHVRSVHIALPGLPHIPIREAIDLLSGTLRRPGEGSVVPDVISFLAAGNAHCP